MANTRTVMCTGARLAQLVLLVCAVQKVHEDNKNGSVRKCVTQQRAGIGAANRREGRGCTASLQGQWPRYQSSLLRTKWEFHCVRTVCAKYASIAHTFVESD